jgi:hypothetical protein
VRGDWIVAGHATASAEAHEQRKTLPSNVSHGDIYIDYVFATQCFTAKVSVHLLPVMHE